jgi:prophage regulatory protein
VPEVNAIAASRRKSSSRTATLPGCDQVANPIEVFTMTDKFLKLPEVMATARRSKPSIYADMKKGLFPTPVKIGARGVAWLESDVNNWMAARIAASKAGASHA